MCVCVCIIVSYRIVVTKEHRQLDRAAALGKRYNVIEGSSGEYASSSKRLYVDITNTQTGRSKHRRSEKLREEEEEGERLE